MIDLNNHLLGEDGSGISLETALAGCEQAWQDGIREIVVTCRAPWQRVRPDDRLAADQLFERRLAALRQAVEGLSFNSAESRFAATNSAESRFAATHRPLNLLSGYEWTLTADLPQALSCCPAAPTINGGSYLLVSFPALRPVPEAEALTEQLQATGWQMIIAHPECSRVLRRDRAILNRLTELGAPIQLDATSLLGGYGKEVEKFAFDLLERGQVRFIATRTNHRARSRVRLSEACQRAARVIGRQAAQSLVGDYPLEVIRQTADMLPLRAVSRWQTMEAMAS